MSLVDTLKDRKIQAMRDKQEIEKNILSVVLGEVQKLSPDKVNDETVVNIIRKMVKSNEETLAFGGSRVDILKKENEILASFLPQTWSVEEIEAFFLNGNGPEFETIQGAGNEGKAIGLAMKTLKAAKAPVLPEDVRAFVQKVMATA